MTDSLKFGPEWLRNMKPENGTTTITTTVTSAIKMAEFRYGREEMLALFDRSILAPDPLKQIQGLHVEKTQPPLALLQMTDEETRMWNRGINSDAVLRLTANKPGGPGAPGGGGVRGGVLGGRGGSVDRGRGRARGVYHYSRGLSYEDSEGFNSSGSYSRNIRSFDRTQGQGSNQWSERNGGGLGADHGDWSGGNMSTSPRKEYSGRSMSDTNWRRHRGSGEEEEGWRSTKHEKWTRSTSWREGDSNWESNRGSSGPTRSWEDSSVTSHSRKPWEPEDSLPEWATENPSDSGGSFDASGAFHGGGVYSDEDDDVNYTSGPTRGESGRGSITTTNHKTTSGNREPSSSIVNGTSQVERLGDGDKSKTSSSGPGLRQSQSASSLSSSNNLPERKTSVPTRSSTSVNLSVVNTKTKPKPCEKLKEEKVTEPPAPAVNVKKESPSKPKPFTQPEPVQPIVHLSSERSEEAMLRMQEAADDLVAKLMEDEEKELPKPTPSGIQQSVSQTPGTVPSNTALADTDKWFYRDPQGTVQGPFLSSEMAEWFKSGYFNLNLQLRRACDERYSPLGELITLWGHIPFLVNSSVPPIKANDNLTAMPTIPAPVVPPAPKPSDEALILRQYQYQQQMLLSQHILKQLSQSERFNALSQLEQQQVLLQQTASLDLGMLSGYLPVPPPPQPLPTPTQSHTNGQSSVAAMIQQLHQQQQQAQVAAGIVAEPMAQHSLDPIQLIQQISGRQVQPPILPQPQMHQKTLDDQRGVEHVMNFIANARKTSQPPPRSQPVKQIESVWGGTATTGPSYSPNWPLPPAPPGQLPSSLWGELHTKGMKTEQEILEEQLRAEEERKKEERRKQEELQRLKEEMEEERARRRRDEEEALERKRKEEEEREKRRLKEEEERRKQEVAAKKAEQERLKKEEEKKRKEEEKRRKEEQKRKQEEEKRKQEEERKKQEEEKRRQEEENKRAEQAKRQAEALKRLQEQQQQQAQARAAVKPSPTPAWTQSETATSTSLSEIQKTERKQQQQLREQQQLLQLIQQQQQQQLQQERNANNKSGSSLNLKWADTKKPTTRVKSLAEIQAEEQEQLAKQTEREKAERMAQAKEMPLPAASSIWANQNLSWNTQNSSSVWGSSTATGGNSSGPGFWEEVVPPATAPKPTNKNKTSSSSGASSATSKPAVTKNRAKKDEMTVLKLFEQQPKCDEFYNWCSKTLSTMQSSVDIPTFVQFLREIEHPFEIQEYIRMYLGEEKDALDFAAQFIERRSRAKAGEPQKRMEHLTAATTNHFQEVKGKNKKIKKGKMLRVDNRILGFSVTAAQDRFNVGDRDYGENV